MNLLDPFLRHVPHWSARTAIIEGGGASITFGALAARSERLAGAWRARGLVAGDRVLLAMPLGIGLYAAIAALWRIGATIVFPEPAMGLKGVRHAAAIARPKALLTSGLYGALRLAVPELWRVPLHLGLEEGRADDSVFDARAEHPALISFTSGSTGAPKGIMRSHGFLAAQNACVAELLRSDEDARDLVAFPVFVIANLGLGITSVLPNWRVARHDLAEAEVIQSHLAAHRVTRALIPPVLCETLARSSRPCGLRAIFTGGGPVFPDLLERLGAAAPQASITAVYGSTEAEPIAHQHIAEIGLAEWNTMRSGGGLLAGKPISQVKLAILDGEITVTGDHVNKGYLGGIGDAQNKRRIEGEIWHRTGDAGRLDESGRLWLLGRSDGIVGGLYPLAVEAAARTWPGVRGAALASRRQAPVLVIEGDDAFAPEWKRGAAAVGNCDVVCARIPLDRRHRSKVDYQALRAMLS